jgi:peptidoglycan/xylan/chitin deacetylase (PgdA/CDA1 family)
MGNSGAFALTRAGTRSQLRILAYHGVQEMTGLVNADGFQVAPSVFASQLEHVAEHFRVVSLGDVVSAIQNGEPWPDRAVLITFDDGYVNNIEHAAPQLTKMGFPAVFYVTTGFIDGTHVPWWYVVRTWIAKAGYAAVGLPTDHGKVASTSDKASLVAWENYLKGMTAAARNQAMEKMGKKLGYPAEIGISFMNWDQVRRLKSGGFDVAPHTVSHINLGSETQAVIEDEISRSIKRVQEEVAPPASYSYPYGRQQDIQPGVLSILQAFGISVGVTTVHGFNKSRANSLLLKRLNITGNHRGVTFEKMLAIG